MAEVIVQNVTAILQSVITKTNIRLINPKNLGSDVYFATFSLTEDQFKALESERALTIQTLKDAEIMVGYLDKDNKEQTLHLRVSEQKTLGVSQMSQTPRLMFYHNPADLSERVTKVVYRTV